jgi:hypothetical protein
MILKSNDKVIGTAIECLNFFYPSQQWKKQKRTIAGPFINRRG